MIKLLIIDDEKAMLDFGKPFFERNGCQVFYASTGKDGLEAFKRENPQAVLLDLGLPDMEGQEILKKIKELSKDTKVAVLTGFSEEEVKDKVLPLNPDAYFTKPCKFPLIIEQIKKWYHK